MEWLWFILAGLAGGLLGGMGMGGGTLLIPILTLMLGISQHMAQSTNLIVFIPMCIIVLFIHIKNKLIDFKAFALTVIPAIGVAVGAGFLAADINEKNLKLYFGIFLLVVGASLLIAAIINSAGKSKKQKTLKNYKNI
ncbi:MAG: sulfite exporter TauE/SafE family protein [Firmicutes bacterium]|nr:sulfite exporter TauE/SafE family protein [Bacillota bacterium]